MITNQLVVLSKIPMQLYSYATSNEKGMVCVKIKADISSCNSKELKNK